MLTQVAINRNTDDSIYGDILDAAEALAAREYGTGTRALVAMIRRSPLFQEIIGELRGSKPTKPQRRKAPVSQ